MPKKTRPPLEINGETWTYLGGGSFNYAYVNKDRTTVLKIMQPKESNGLGTDAEVPETDTPERSVRLWNEINPTPPFATEFKMEDGTTAWTCPYVSGEEPNGMELSIALINVFNKCQRIVIDGTSEKNFIKLKNGEILCVDIGLALQLDLAEEATLKTINDTIDRQALPRLKRRDSVTSNDVWQQRFYSMYSRDGGVFDNHAEYGDFKIAVNTAKSLLFIKKYRPDIVKVDFLKNNIALIGKLAAAYDQDYRTHKQRKNTKLNPQIIVDAKEILNQIAPNNLDSLKKSLKTNLERYIISRGKIEKSHEKINKITLHSNLSSFFRSSKQKNKLLFVQRLIENIEKAQSFEEIKSLITKARNDPIFNSPSIFRSELKQKTLAFCNVILDSSAQFFNLELKEEAGAASRITPTK